MTEVHHQTRKAADIALAKRTISRASYDAILAGEISLQAARDLGRDGAPRATDGERGPGTATEISRDGSDGAADTPPEPVSRISKHDRTPTKTPCLCGCGTPVPRTFAPGHDAKMHRLAYEYVRGERELTEEQLEYVTTSGKLERARKRVEREEQTNRQKADS